MNMFNDYITFWQEKYEIILEYALQHIVMSFVAIVVAVVFSVPLATYMTKMRSNKIKNIIFNIANVFQTIPTIAMFALMVPFLGIGFKPAVVALFLYALLPLLRNTYTGMKSIDPTILEAAKGMGFSSLQRIVKVEVPLALPYIMSGVRMTTVYIISWTTLAAVVGAGGLGALVISGIGFNDKHMIFTGTILAILMALFIDLIFARVENYFIKNN